MVEDAAGSHARIRLRNVDAPELDEIGGPKAKADLEQRLLGKRIRLKIYARDKCGRTIATIE